MSGLVANRGISMNFPQIKVPWQKVCTNSSFTGFVPVFFASCSPSLLRKSVLGVRGSSVPLLWTYSASAASPCDQDGFHDLFAPFVKAVLMPTQLA